mgnify:CR=1 FL=1
MPDEFLDQLNIIKGWDKGEPLPENVFEGIEKGYQALVDQRDGASVTIDDLKTSNNLLTAEVNRLKSENYDLAIVKGSTDKETESPKESPKGINGLFNRKGLI